MRRYRAILTIAGMASCVLLEGLCQAGGAETSSIPEPMATGSNLAVPPAFIRFIREKKALEESIAKKYDLKVPAQVWDFFAAAQKGDWASASNLFFVLEAGIHPRSGERWLPAPLWGAIHDAFGPLELIEAWSPEFLDRIGNEIVKSIPPGSIYFGGTDSGRFAVSLFSQSHTEGRPFFTLTQNALADPTYLNYLGDMYGGKIYIPNTNETRPCWDAYLQDAETRLKHDRDFPDEPLQIKRGEDVRIVGGKVQASGQVAVMNLNGRIVKVIMDKNPKRDFYYEESLSWDSVYPQLTPHQFIFRLNREPVSEIRPATTRADREFWTRWTDSWLGAWLGTDTPVSEVADFARRIYLQSDLKEFKGDPRFIRDLEARKAFAKLRTSIAGVYAWRVSHSKSPEERRRMLTEADFAFRQAFAISPGNPETVYRYIDLLLAEGRNSDALRIASTARRVNREYPPFEGLIQSLIEKQRGKNTPAQ